MNKIELQKKTKALPGSIVSYWFENKSIDLNKTLFHKITIPLEKFDSGLAWVNQPEDTGFEFDWYKLVLDNPSELDGMDLSYKNYTDSEGSVYIGSAHNWCYPNKFKLKEIGKNRFLASCEILIEFEGEGVAQNEIFSCEVELKYKE